MNPRIIKLGVESGMLNYVDHETPRHYFLSAHADEECLERFAELIVRKCLDQCYNRGMNDELYAGQLKAASYIEQHFGVGE
jgi:hypothetical protein